MKFVFIATLSFLFLPALALGQEKADDPDKVSNDRPDRPLQMPPASSEVKEAFDDFERFRRRGAWERALKSLYSIPKDQEGRFVDGKDGYIIPVTRKRRAVLGELPPDGLATYRLFYDDEAKKLLDEADGPTELATLERVFSAYFLTTQGDNAADRLGDLYYEQGRFDRAADCWLAVLRDHPDTDLPLAQVAVKAALALNRAERRSEIPSLRNDLADRYANEKVTIGGVTAPVSEHIDRYLADPQAAKPSGNAEKSSASPLAEPDLSHAESAVWQVRFNESVIAGMSPAERIQWDSNPLSAAIPAVATVDNRLYANYLGYIFALNLDNGKLLWRSGSFHNLDIPAAQNQSRMIDPTRYAVLANTTHVWSLSKDLKDPNFQASFQLACRRADGGDLVWQSSGLPDYAQVDLVGTPILSEGTIYAVGKTPMMMQNNQSVQYILAIRGYDGKVLWKVELGNFRQSQRYFYYGMSDDSPLPRLFKHAGAIFADTHAGILARLDAESGEIDWGYGYKTEPEDSNRFFFYYSQPKESSASSVPLKAGDALIVKGAKSDRIGALDADRMALIWDRPIAKSARVVGANGQTIFLGGPELSALDIKTRKLLWATRLPGGSAAGKVLVGPSGIWQNTPRGIFEVDPKTGRVRRIFRGDDTGSEGGDLTLSNPYILAITNRTISAYPVSSAAVNTGKRAENATNSKTRATNE